MKKIFVVTDNKFIFKEFKRITAMKNLQIEYFCSPKSSITFQKEIDDNSIKPLILNENIDFFIHNTFDLGFSCHSKQLFPAAIVNNILCINIHPGLNPYNRGWYPQVFSIINGLPAGATIHVMDEKIDHGDIIIQKEIKINSYDNSWDVYNRIQLKEMELLEKVFDHLLDNKFLRISPASEGNYNSIHDYKNICSIDLTQKVTMKEAIDFLRAMTHPPYKNAHFYDENGNKIYISIELELAK